MKKPSIGIRGLFRISILVVVVLAYFAITAISYTNTTSGERAKAEASIRSEVNYLCLQLKSQSERSDAFDRITSSSEMSPEELASISPEDYRLLSDPIGDVLSGYTLAETGTVALIVDDAIVATDDERLPVGSNVRELLGDEVCNAIDASLQSGELQSIPYDGVFADSAKTVIGTDDSEAFLMAGQQGDCTVMIIEPSSMVFRDRSATIGRESIVALVILIVVSLIVERLLSIVVARRIDKTNEVLERIVAGDLTARVEDAGTHEFKELAFGINSTVVALQNWIAEAETRMDAELAAARAIQESALPRTFPPYPDVPKIDVYASMNAAREVGGDFYDFFPIGAVTPDSGKFAFLVADVSGKGIPASLFMMKSVTQIRDYLKSGMEIGEAIGNANHQLVDGNDAGMFVTVWVGVLDYGSGRVDFVNAGHNPPLLWQKDSGWRWIEDKSGLPLGLFDGLPYESYSIECGSGDQFLLYTDGVTEAMNVEGELYGEKRLEALVNENSALHPRKLVEAVRDDVARHSEGAEQSDDITVLSLEVGAPPEIAVTTISSAGTPTSDL